MRLAITLTFCLSVLSLTYSQTPENPWTFDVGVNSVTVKDENGSKLSLPTLSLSRYVFGNFSLGLNFSENNVEVSNKDLYYYSLDGIIKYDISNQAELLGIDIDPYILPVMVYQNLEMMETFLILALVEDLISSYLRT